MRTYPGASYAAARVGGCRLLAKPCIRQEIKAALAAQTRAARASASKVSRAAARVAFADPLELFEDDPDGELRLRNLREVPVALRQAVTSRKVKRVSRKTAGGGTRSVEVFEVRLNARVA